VSHTSAEKKVRGKHISKLSLASQTEICPRIRSLLASQELEQQHVHRVSSNKSCRSHPCSGISTLIAYAHLPSYLPSIQTQFWLFDHLSVEE